MGQAWSIWIDSMIVELDHRLFLAQDYALINPLQVGRDQYADLDLWQLVPKGLERHQRMLPLLVHLSNMEESRRLDLLERAGEWARHHHMPLFSALLSSQHAPEQVRASLLSRMLLRREDGSRAWLRYHDPRVFRHLQWLLDMKQLATLMWPMHTWMAFDPLLRCWLQWSRPDIPRHPRLGLDARQWRAIGQFEALNNCLRDLADEGEASDDDTARRLLEGLLEARRQGLEQGADAMLYARQQLEHGPGIACLPAVALRLRQTRERDTSYVVACDTLRKEDFLRREGVA